MTNYDDFITVQRKLNQKFENITTTLNINIFAQQLSIVPLLRYFYGLPGEDFNEWLDDFDYYTRFHGWTTKFQRYAPFLHLRNAAKTFYWQADLVHKGLSLLKATLRERYAHSPTSNWYPFTDIVSIAITMHNFFIKKIKVALILNHSSQIIKSKTLN